MNINGSTSSEGILKQSGNYIGVINNNINIEKAESEWCSHPSGGKGEGVEDYRDFESSGRLVIFAPKNPQF